MKKRNIITSGTTHCKVLLKNFYKLLLIPILLLTLFHCELHLAEINQLNEEVDALRIANNNLQT